MLLIIPSIDLSNAHALRCVVGTPGTEALYSEISDHPVELAQRWRRENAKCIHVTDTDSLKGANCIANLAMAIELQKAIDIPVQFLTWQPTVDDYRRLLDAGVYRVGLSSVAYTDPDGVRRLVDDFGASRVIFAVRAHNGDVDCGPRVGMIADEEYIRTVYELGGRRTVYTEVDWEGNLTGEDLKVITRIASVAPMKFTMAGGIASPQHLWTLQDSVPRNVDSVVIGRAMYENRFPCQNIWRNIEAKLEPEIHAHAHENSVQSSISKLASDDV